MPNLSKTDRLVLRDMVFSYGTSRVTRTHPPH